MRVFFLSLFLALTGVAQQGSFSVDEQGRAWFFTNWVPPETNLRREYRLYSVTDSVPRLELGDSPELLSVGVTSDGSTTFWTHGVYERAPISGFVRFFTGTVVRRTPLGEKRIVHSGFVGVSRNGEWAVWSKPNSLSLTARTLWVNLVTGEEISQPGLEVSTDSIGSDGSVVSVAAPVSTSGGAVSVHAPRKAVDVIRESSSNNTRGLLSSDARRLLLLEGRVLAIYDRDTRERIAINGFGEWAALGVLSPSGTLVAYLQEAAMKQILVLDANTKTTRALPVLDDNVANLQFSDDGATLWVKTVALAILRIDLASGETTVVMPPTPSITAVRRKATPGARFRIDGQGLAAANKVLLGKESASITGRGPGWLQVLLPNGLDGSCLGCMDWSTSSPDAPLEAPGLATAVLPQYPEFLSLYDLGESDPNWAIRPVAFAASDGGLLNYPDRPALAGEEVLFWMTGIGDHKEKVRFGLYLPYESGSRADELLDYAFTPDPNNQGWWILRFRLPTGISSGSAIVLCVIGTRGQTGDAAFYVSSGSKPSSESSK